MKKYMIAGLVITALGSLANAAGSISLDSRADFESRNYNDAYNTRGYNRFNMQTLRIDGKGNFNENTAFRVRFRLNKNTTSSALGNNSVSAGSNAYYTINSKDSVGDQVDYGYIQQKIGDGLTLLLGKYGTDIGAVEGTTTSADLYFTSAAFNEQQILRYATGAKLAYLMGDQEFDVMTFNQQTDAIMTAPTSATLNFDQNHEGYGVVYKGSFFEKTLLPILSYHSDSVQSTGTTGVAALDKKYDYYSAGLKYDMNPLFVELDYLMDNFKNKSVTDEVDSTNSIVGTLGYKWENLVAKVKYENSESKIFASTAGVTTSPKTKVNAYQLSAEYMPSGDKNLRYHAVYVSRDTKPETGDTKTDQTVIVGVRLLADFLK